MPESCFAVGCSQRRVKGCGIPLYIITKAKTPFEARTRRDWIKAVNRDQCSEECGNHFVSG